MESYCAVCGKEAEDYAIILNREIYCSRECLNKFNSERLWIHPVYWVDVA